MFQASPYKILSQELQDENEFSSSQSSDDSQDSLDLVLLKIGNKRPNRNKNNRRTRMARFDGFESYEELIGSAKRKKQFMILGGLCLLAILVIVAIVLSVMLINKDTKNENLEDIELDDILQSKLQPNRFNGTWIDDKTFYYFDVDKNFIIYDAEKREAKVTVANNSTAYNVFVLASSFEFSADLNFILLSTQILKLYRHSFIAIWQVYDMENKNIINISTGSNINDQTIPYRLVKFGSTGNAMIIVDKSNLYYKSSAYAAAVNLTHDGNTDGDSIILNGVPDWVYEEEIFSSNSATWFSADGNKLAFIQFDDTQVPAIALNLYGLPGEYKYPQVEPVQYPKVGAKNPSIKLFNVDLNNPTTLIEIPTPNNLDSDHLIISVAWANDNDLISVWTNRIQNRGLVYKCTGDTCVELLSLDTTVGWIEFTTTPLFNKAGTEMIFIGENEDYKHIKVLDINTKVVTSRTSGKFVVTEILKYNKEHDIIIYTANLPEDIRAQHIYAIKNEADATAECLTCNLHSGHTYYSAEVSEGGSHLVITANGPDVPRVDLYTLKIDGSNIELSAHLEIENNEDIRNILNSKKMPKKVYDVIELDGGAEAYVVMTLPRDLDESKKYPMLVDVYGGPDSSAVTNRFSIDWGTYLAASLGIVYVRIDGRGSGLRSQSHLHLLYRKLGTIEIDDQVSTAQKLQEKYSYLDSNHTGIWGWSYGGFVAGMSLMRDNDVFKCATSVAPVIDWMLYDSIYTERYMQTPDLNANAYNISRMTNYVENIRKHNKQFMLVHGVLDDNVHFQQGMVLARVLERSDIQFREVSYPDENHSLAGVRPHLYHSLERFFRGCFNLTN